MLSESWYGGYQLATVWRAVGHGGYQVSSVGNVRVGVHGGGASKELVYNPLSWFVRTFCGMRSKSPPAHQKCAHFRKNRRPAGRPAGRTKKCAQMDHAPWRGGERRKCAHKSRERVEEGGKCAHIQGCVGASVRRCVGASSPTRRTRLKTDQPDPNVRTSRGWMCAHFRGVGFISLSPHQKCAHFLPRGATYATRARAAAARCCVRTSFTSACFLSVGAE